MAAEGRSGGILTLWNSTSVSVLASFRSKGYLGTKVRWRNIYITSLMCIHRVL